MKFRIAFYIFLLALPLFKPHKIFAQDEILHEFTIFLIQSAHPVDWQDPSTLYKTVKKSMVKKLLHRKKGLHVYGHSTFNLKSGLINNDTLWEGITSNASLKDELRHLFKEKVGLGVLGIPFPSKLEGKDRIVPDLTLNQRHSEACFVTFLISEESAAQILSFIQYFHSNYQGNFPPPSSKYSVGYWPLYGGEGAACLSLCLASLESGGIFLDEKDKKDWNIRVRIPMELIGGSFNPNNKVKIREIKKTKNWYPKDSLKNVDFIDFDFYEPNNMIEWVKQQLNDSTIQTYQLPNGVQLSGLRLDYRHIKPQQTLKELMTERPDPSLFYIQPPAILDEQGNR